ncbi:MAG: sigma 54-interacting transcriptional regulator [Candidatus Zixiibacteriota bacterium]
MKDPSVEFSKDLKAKFEQIEKLLQGKKYRQALAEIRDFESSRQIDRIPLQELCRFYYVKACALRFSGSYLDASDNAMKAFSLVKDTNDSKRIAEVQFVSGLIHIDLGNLKSAETEIRDALTSFRRVSDLRGMISALSKLAFIESIKGNYPRSVEFLSDALKCCDQMKDDRHKTILYGNLGARFLMMGRWDKAEENLLLNIELNEKAGDEINLCRGLLSLGYVYFLKREFGQSGTAWEKSLVLIKRNNCVRELAIYHEYAGELEFAQGNYEKAKNHYLDAIAIGEQVAPEGDIISQTYRLLAELQIAEKQYDEGLLSCDKALKVATSLGEKIEIGAIHRALGQIHTAKHQKERAEESFEKSILILEQIGAKFELGKAYLETLRSDAFGYVDRIAYYARGREIFRELGSDYHIGKITLIFCEFLAESGEYEKAETYLNDSERIFRSLNEERDLTLVQDLKRRINKWLGEPDSSDGSRRREHRFCDIITQDPHLLALLEQARKFKDSDISILLEGETGTGKDLLAQVIHNESRRKNKRFVKMNCAAIPESLLESELFGHKKGSFTGADKDKRGFFEEADGGTIFLNEIGDLPLRLQAKILDVIEDKEVTRVGEVQPRKVDFRVIVATNKNLSEEVNRGNFREDLYHRLNVVKLRLPPLREREKDIPLLTKHFLAERGVDCQDLDELTYSQDFLRCRWPGNIRQLANEVKRLVSVLNPFDGRKLLEELGKSSETNTQSAAKNSLLGKKAEVERTEIVEVIKKCDGDKLKAAKSLGVSRATLYRKIRDHNLET